jgi:hypothetical protein
MTFSTLWVFLRVTRKLLQVSGKYRGQVKDTSKPLTCIELGFPYSAFEGGAQKRLTPRNIEKRTPITFNLAEVNFINTG